MAQHQAELIGDADALLTHLDTEIQRSISASIEDTTDQRLGGARMVVRAYERYSAFGGNRVSLTVSLLAAEGRLAVSMVTAGGSEAMFWKVNTVGEESFLARAVEALESFAGGRPSDGAVV